MTGYFFCLRLSFKFQFNVQFFKTKPGSRLWQLPGSVG